MDKNLAYKLHYLTRLLMTHLNEATKPLGVTQGQLPVLCCLWDEEGQTQAELCEKIQVEQPTMANTLRRMERDGQIYRTPCDKDRRQSRIFLTETTRPTVLALQQKRDQVLAQMTRQMSAEEVNSLHCLLDNAMRALETKQTEEIEENK